MDEKLSSKLEPSSSVSSPVGTVTSPEEQDLSPGEGQNGGSRGPPVEILLPISRLLPLSIAYVSFRVQKKSKPVF
jgi:hypothetical protein